MITVVTLVPAIVCLALAAVGKRMYGGTVAAALLALFGPMAVWVSVRCPNCRLPIARAAVRTARRNAGHNGRCPRCGISFNTPWLPGASSGGVVKLLLFAGGLACWALAGYRWIFELSVNRAWSSGLLLIGLFQLVGAVELGRRSNAGWKSVTDLLKNLLGSYSCSCCWRCSLADLVQACRRSHVPTDDRPNAWPPVCQPGFRGTRTRSRNGSSATTCKPRPARYESEREAPIAPHG
jgi:hypothetical protein